MVNPGIDVHGFVVQLGYCASSIELSSPTVGILQSQCPAKHPVVVLPSADTPALSDRRNTVKAVPSGGFAGSSQATPPSGPSKHHEYVLSLSCTLPSSVFSSH